MKASALNTLQYKRRSTEQGSSPGVDWEEVDNELCQVNAAFRDPRFDSLKHVLTVLSSENAEAEVEELREQRARIEELVDAVVEGYHSGFNKSIHNYSQILRLFTESKLQLESLRRSLESALRRLSAQSRHMAAQWQRHVMLSDTLRLLGDIAVVAELPQRVQRLEENKEWAAAVTLLLDGCNKLARQELSQVGALAELKEEMGKRRSSLQDSIVGELEARIYKLEAVPAPLRAEAGGGGVVGSSAGGGTSMNSSGAGPSCAAGGPAAAGPAGVPRLQLPLRGPGGGSNEGEGAGSCPAEALLPNSTRAAAGSGLLGRTNSWGNAQPAPAPSDLTAGASGALPRRPVHRRAHTSTGLLNPVGALASVDGHLVDPEVPLSTLVDCLAQIGAIADAQAALRKHMPQRLRGAILRALELFPASKHLPPDERFHYPSHSSQQPQQQQQQPQQPQQHCGGAGGASSDAPIPPEVVSTAQALVEHVLSCCLQIFHRVVQLLHMLAHARAPKPSSGLELLLAQQRLQQQRAMPQPTTAAMQGPEQLQSPPQQQPQPAPQQQPQPQQPAGPPAERAKEECQAAWDALQCECERLLGCLLRMQQAPGLQQLQGSGQGDLAGPGWLASASYLGPGGAPRDGSSSAAVMPLDPGTLTFSLVHEVDGLLPAAAALAWGASGAGGEGGDAVGEKGRAGAAQEEGAEEQVVRLLRHILGGHPGGAALVPALYRPVLQFAEAGEHTLSSTAVGSGASEGGGRISQLFSMPWRAASDSGAAAAAAGERSRLRAYVESFLRMEFLPAVYVDFRARCASMLDDPDAFRPRARLRGATAVGEAGAGRPGLLPAALATEAVVEELLSWAALMPPFATHLTGVVENILGRVLEAFIGQLAGAAVGSAAGRLAESVALVRLMAREPSATLLASPVAFFVGGNTDAMESFVSSVIAAGFGANDESVERELLAKLLAERPLPPGALLCGGGDARRLTLLAALSDSCDYVAEVIQRCTAAWALSAGGTLVTATPRPFGVGVAQGGHALPPGAPTPGSGGGGSMGVTPRGELTLLPTPRTGSSEGGWAGRLVGGWRGRGGGERGLTEGLSHLADRYRAVAGACMRVLRLDLLLLVVAQLGELPRSRYVCSEEEGKEVDECVGALSRSVCRLDEELAAYLPPHKRAYAFCSLAPAAARIAVWLLPELGEINHNGVSRMCRMLASLQPALLGVGGPAAAGPNGAPVATPSAASRPEAARQFDKAKLYYTLLTYSPEGLLATVADKPRRFSPAEYSALLAASVPERAPVTPEHRAALQRLLEAAGAGGKGGGGSRGGGGKGGAALAAFVKAVVKPQHSQSQSQSL